MKSSIFIAASGAVMSLAAALDKRAMETVWDVEWVTVTVTAGQEPPAQTPGQFFEDAPKDDAPAPVYSTVTPDPAPEPEKEEAPVVVEPTPQPEPEPTPAPAPAPKPETTPQSDSKPQTESVSAPTSGSMKDAALYHHNIHRQNHSAPALEWGQKYADYALQTAKTCVFEHDL